MRESFDDQRNNLSSSGKPRERGKNILSLYTYAILPGNNAQLVHRVMQQSYRGKYWHDSSYLYIKSPMKNLSSHVAPKTVMPLQVNFKWSPCSIKSDFIKL